MSCNDLQELHCASLTAPLDFLCICNNKLNLNELFVIHRNGTKYWDKTYNAMQRTRADW